MLVTYTTSHISALVSGLPVPGIDEKLLAPQNFVIFHSVIFLARFQICSSPSSDILICSTFYTDSDSLGCTKSNVLSNF